MNEGLIIFLLVLLVIEAAFSIYNNRITLGRNAEIAMEGEKLAREKLLESIKSVHALENIIIKERGKRLEPAFLITPNGIKVLPNGWQKHFNAAWEAKPE